MKAITANSRIEPQEWSVHFWQDNAENRFQARMALRDLGAERFKYERAYDIVNDAMRLRVTGRLS
jgi:hypothetical protein